MAPSIEPSHCYSVHPLNSKTTLDEMQRCPWARSELMVAYHDQEWGVPLHDDRALFEFLILEGAQAGLSWETILKKRAAYRTAFHKFDARKIARYDAKDQSRLLADAGIVRNRLKIAAAIRNAQAMLEVQSEFGTFDRYLWQFARDSGRRRQAAAGRLAIARRSAGSHGGIRRHEQRPAAARIQVRRLDDLLRLHASHRHGERPPGRLLSLRGNRVETR